MKQQYELEDGVKTSLVILKDKWNITYQLGPTEKITTSETAFDVSFKRYKKFVKGQIDGENFKTDGLWGLALAERLRPIKIAQLLGIPHLNILTGQDDSFHTNYRLVLSPELPNMAGAIIYTNSIPDFCPKGREEEFIKAFKQCLWMRPLTITQCGDPEDEKSYLPMIMFDIKAKTVAEACKVAEIFLEEIESEAKAQLGIS